MSSASQIAQIHLEPKHLRTVREVLREYVPDREVWAFGSRANGLRLKPYSDLDLAVSGQLSIEELGSLMEAFEESTLPIKVDVLAVESLSADFAERIRRDFVLLQRSSSNGQAEAH